ncbi:MAG: 5'-3' exonuclease H3TH domain-containing protein [Deltaproteobacteria bacterium]
MNVHLVDGTYELFRHYFAVPSHADADGKEAGAIRGVLASVLSILEGGATHIGVATDHIVESFRNQLYEGYKTGEGIEPELHAQFHPLEDALEAMGVTVWRMTEFEADDGLASAAALAWADPRIEQIQIMTPDKDLAQCVQGTRVVMVDRRKGVTLDEAGVIEKFGVAPASIPDYLALVGDAADGFPGLAGWGAKSASKLLAKWLLIEAIPDDPDAWDVAVRGAPRLAATLASGREEAALYKDLATLRTSAAIGKSPDEWLWTGPRDDFAKVAEQLRAGNLVRRAARLVERRAG